MKRLVSRFIVALATIAFGIVSFAVSAFAPALAQAPAPNFGTPPSGEVPILYNDQHVYSKPDRLKKGRVLAALVRGKTILVPLRSMFEQMGGTVSYNASTKTVDVSKPGADVQVTVGKAEVVINGESRPLDVPPEIYKGSLVVPLRVISEGMGAYVQWVADKRLVVVRYLNAPVATPPPAPPATAAPVVPVPVPTAIPTKAPTPTPITKPPAEFFVAGDVLFNPKVYNEFSPGNRGGISGAARAGLTFSFDQLAFLAEGDYRYFRYPHRGSTAFDGRVGSPNFSGSNVCSPTAARSAFGDQGCVTVLGGNGQAFVNSFDARDTDIDGRLGVGIANPKVFLVGSYGQHYGNYGYPRLTGFGGGLEKLSDFSQPVSIYGSILYYPQMSGNYTDTRGVATKLQYRLLKYQGGLTINVPRSPLFLDFGYLGDRLTNKQNAPSNSSLNSLYGGIGLHF
ncbi:MAG: hypothetical protein NVS3B16_13350 [Vulcanimicrobiaceae bacterium]